MTDIAEPTEHVEAVHDDHDDHGATSLGISNMKLAMWLFLGSECLLFGALISTYLLTKTRFLTELIAGNPRVVDTMPAEIVAEMQAAGSVEPMFDIPFTSFSSFVLLMSSLAMVLAHSAVVRGDYKNTKLWIATTALLGTIFIGGQVYEFTAFYREGLSFTNNLFGSAFFTLTGFHGIHVTVGILMLMALLVVAQQGKLNQDRAETVELVGLYWHFVDLVWIFLFPLIYII